MNKVIGRFECPKCGYVGNLKPGGCPRCNQPANIEEVIKKGKMNTERKPMYYRDLYEKETGKAAEAPTYLDEPRYFNPGYVEWLEKRIIETPSPPQVTDKRICDYDGEGCHILRMSSLTPNGEKGDGK